MAPTWRKNVARLLGGAVAFVVLSCSDQSTTPGSRVVAPDGASKAISDGAHGGNTDVWFLPPMVANPVGKTGYGDAFAPGLPVAIKVKDMTANTYLAGAPSAVTMSLTDQLYQANWDTKSPALDPTHVYRVEVSIGTMAPIAYADVDVVSSSQLKNISTGDVIALVDGRTLPIKVRIEEGWNCQNNSSCVSQVVPATIPTSTSVTVKTNDGKDWITFHGDDATGNWNNLGQPVIVTVEDVSAQLGGSIAGCAQGITNVLADAHCIKITTDPAITLTTTAVVCMTLPSYHDDWKLVKYDSDEQTKFLADPPAGVCPTATPTIGSATHSSNPFLRLASQVGNALRRLVTPRLAYAFDLGVGGTVGIGDGFSFFAAGLPAEMVKVAGDGQTAHAGTVVPIAPAVQILSLHHHHDPVGGAIVTCQVTSGGGSVAASGLATELPLGTYTCPNWTLGAAGGTNTLQVTANILDATMTNGSATFTATGGLVSSVSVTPATATVATGQTVPLTANVTVVGGASTAVTWSSSDPTKATVSAAGVVTGVSAGGPVTITATSVYDNTKSGTASITVTGCATLCITSLVPSTTNVTLESGDPITTYSVTIHNGTGVTQTGVFIQGLLDQGATERAAGGTVTTCPSAAQGSVPNGDCTFTHVISASNLNGGSGTLVPGSASFVLQLFQGVPAILRDSKTIAVTLLAPATVSVSVSPTVGLVDVGSTLPLTATVSAAAGVSTTVDWLSSNTAVATVNASGVVTGVSVGTATIKARSRANFTQSASAAITVQAAGTGTFIGSFGISNDVAALPSNPSGEWTATVVNPAGALTLQGVWIQGTNVWPSGGTSVTCPATGPCVVSFSYATSNLNGIGPLVPGPATLVLRLIDDGTSATIDSKSIPVTLVVPQ